MNRNGNPFYVEPIIPDMSDQIMEFGKMAMQKDNLAQQRLLEERRLTGDETYRKGMLENANQDLALKREEAYAKNPNIRPYSNGEYTKLLVGLQTAGIPTDKISFINGPLKEMAKNPDFKRGDIANMMEQKWPEIYNQTSEEVRNEILSLSKKATGMSPMDPKYKEVAGQIEKLGQFQSTLDNIKNPKEIFFKDIYQYDQNTKAALLAQGDAERAARLNPDTQFMDNKTKQYISQGMTPQAANVKAYQDLSNIQAAKARAGRTQVNVGGGAPLPANTPAGIPGQKNEAALQGVSAGDAAVIKQLAEYKIPLPSGMALRTPYWQNILGRVALYDPTFDATQYNVRMAVKRDFTSGTSSKTALSLNTAIGHLETLAKAADELNNSSFTPINSVVNRIQPLVGDPRVKKLNTTANAVAGELATVFKNTSGTDQEIKSWREQFSAYDSPKQIKEGGVNQAIELIGSRLGALRNKYEQGLGKPIDFHILSPKSRKILKSLGADVDALDPGGLTINSMSGTGGRPPLSSFQK